MVMSFRFITKIFMICSTRKTSIFVHRKMLINMSYSKIVMGKYQLRILPHDLLPLHMKFVKSPIRKETTMKNRFLISLDTKLFARRCTKSNNSINTYEQCIQSIPCHLYCQFTIRTYDTINTSIGKSRSNMYPD